MGEPLDRGRWARVDELFAEALTRAPGDREAWLASECGDDSALRTEVQSLLDAAGTGLRRRVSAVERMAESVVGGGDGGGVGEILGPYRLEEEIGRGGMSVVYRGVRTDGAFQQTVAVKVVPGALFDQKRVERFGNERRILAGLEHPNIARLLDGGTTHGGVPYVIMEYVDGLPLDRYAEGADLEDRIWLFLQVCDAVAYAHRQLVVHRDLKPSNILVTRDGDPKLLDFGIAKLVAMEAEAENPVTRTRLMTPRYASPEQLLGDRVGTASDVYSLGIVLYELLAGVLPRRSEGEIDDGHVSQLRETFQRPPSPPSAACGDRRLRGDLDTIVLKAMSTDPDQRFDSVRALGDDLERYLTGRPVSACRPSLAYRTRKFVGRNKGAVLAASLAVVALLLQAGLFLVRIAAERDAAEREAARAARTLDFVTDVFDTADPFASGVAEMSALDILQRGTARLDEDPQLADEPATRAEILTAVGNVYENLGALDSARAVFARSLALREETFGPSSLESSRGLSELGGLMIRTDELDEARALLERALAIRTDALPARHPDIAVDLGQLAQLAHRAGRLERSDSLFRAALAILDDPLEPRESLRATVRSDHGLLLLALDRPEEAEASLREALRIRRTLFGERHPEVAVVKGHLARVHEHVGRYEEAEALYRELLRVGPVILGDDHRFVTTWMNNLAAVLKELGRLEEAVPLAEEVLRRRRQEAVEDRGDVATALNNLANLYGNLGRLADAESVLREALEVNRRTFGPDHPRVATNLNNLATLLWRRSDFEAAAQMQERVLEMDRRQLGSEHEFVAQDMVNLGTYRLYAGDVDAAEGLLRDGLERMLQIRGDDHLASAQAMAAYADWLVAEGRAEEAVPLARRSLEVRSSILAAADPVVAQGRSTLGAALLLTGDLTAAGAELRAAAEIMAGTLPARDPARVRNEARLQRLEDARRRLGASPPSR
ncbi:MAG: serine/threonine-protein kinase [Longimicrobiales bacterium]|nr:serine/threonine-protein kinase [Longimicrobiales bacterium]